MATQATAVWRIRVGGSDANGGGFDPGIASAGTDYSQQDSAQLSVSDAACNNSTTLTSATGGFTAAMIGNCIRISGGANFTAGYYWVTARTDTNTITLDRNPTNGSNATGGTAALGGAFANLSNLCTGGGGGAASPPSQLSAGNIIYMRGSGSNDPTSADYTDSTYRSFPAGTLADGYIALIGENGRPRVDQSYGVWLQSLVGWVVKNICVYQSASPSSTNGMIQGSGLGLSIQGCLIDANGYDTVGVNTARVVGNTFRNTGATQTAGTANTRAAINASLYGNMLLDNVINGWRGDGIRLNGAMGQAVRNTIINCKQNGIYLNGAGANYAGSAELNAIYNNSQNGIYIADADGLAENVICKNIIANNGAYGIYVAVGTTALNDRTKGICDYNCTYNNLSGPYYALSAGANDVALSAAPFVDASGGDLRVKVSSEIWGDNYGIGDQTLFNRPKASLVVVGG